MKRKRNKKKRRLNISFEDYVLKYLKSIDKEFLRDENYDALINKMEKFKFINQYFEKKESYDNKNFQYKLHHYLTKKVKIRYKFKDLYIRSEFDAMKTLWKNQIIFCYISAIQGSGNLSMLLISTLESYFRLIAKEEKISIISIKDDEDYDTEKNKTVTYILENLKKLYDKDEYKFVYYTICKMNLRNKYCHGNLEGYSEKHLCYIVLNIIYTLFLKGKKNEK